MPIARHTYRGTWMSHRASRQLLSACAEHPLSKTIQNLHPHCLAMLILSLLEFTFSVEYTDLNIPNV